MNSWFFASFAPPREKVETPKIRKFSKNLKIHFGERNSSIECWFRCANRELHTTPTKAETDTSKIMIFATFADPPAMVQNLGSSETLRSSYGSSWGFACTKLWPQTKLEKYFRAKRIGAFMRKSDFSTEKVHIVPTLTATQFAHCPIEYYSPRGQAVSTSHLQLHIKNSQAGLRLKLRFSMSRSYLCSSPPQRHLPRDDELLLAVLLRCKSYFRPAADCQPGRRGERLAEKQ